MKSPFFVREKPRQMEKGRNTLLTIIVCFVFAFVLALGRSVSSDIRNKELKADQE